MNEFILEVTWPRLLRVWWSFLWRNLLATVGAMIVGGLFGGILGFILGLVGIPVETIKIVCLPVGLGVGILFTLLPIWWILGKNFGEFRLVLLANPTAIPPAAPTASELPQPPTV